ncbi:MAG: methionine--tRNA ligase [Saprospiraceae bacterium]|nr:methionine--tRNA ligase [Saprospiraceae bacterium]
MLKPKRYLVTSALPYANGPLHIGHLAGAYLNADIYVRWLRAMGEEVLFVCGSDEHGAAITIRAMKDGLTPKEIVDKYHELFGRTFKEMGISFDVYHRTSAELHHETSQEFFRTLYQNSSFTQKESEQYFDEKAGVFLADRYIKGICPNCQNPEAYGDQCEKCGSTLNPTDLGDPRSVLSGDKPVMRSTSHWYLPLERHEEWLRTWINDGILDGKLHHDPRDWKNHVLGQCRSWLDAGLQPRAMTRDLDWGVDVPSDIPGSAGKKLYVWMDAPIGYISATKHWAEANGTDWTTWWQDPESALIHFIGKDNIVFHCLIFPVILREHGFYNLPINVPANQFMNLEGNKISTSRNWAVWVHEYLEEFPGMQDSLRYNMIRNMPEQKDSEFTWKNFQETHNSELVNNLANFINRVLVLTHKFMDGVLVAGKPNQQFISGDGTGRFTSLADELVTLGSKVAEIDVLIRHFNFREALQKVMEISMAGNQLLQANEPWAQAKSAPEDMRIVLFAGVQYVHLLSKLIRPFLPFAADRLAGMLGAPSMPGSGELNEMMVKLQNGQPLVDAGHRLGEASHLFGRIADEVIDAQIQKLHKVEPINTAVSDDSDHDQVTYALPKAAINYDQFNAMDLRTGRIIAAEKVPKADRLLKLDVDLGYEKRTVVSGIAAFYAPEDIIGQQVVVLINLEPRMLRGIESQGMILMATAADGRLVFVTTEGPVAEGMGIS